VVLDTNVRRVLTRVLVGQAVPTPHLTAADRDSAAAFLPSDAAEAAVWNVGLMELGALVCTVRTPDCEACPPAARCAWLRAGKPRGRRPSTARPALGRHRPAGPRADHGGAPGSRPSPFPSRCSGAPSTAAHPATRPSACPGRLTGAPARQVPADLGLPADVVALTVPKLGSSLEQSITRAKGRLSAGGDLRVGSSVRSREEHWSRSASWRVGMFGPGRR